MVRNDPHISAAPGRPVQTQIQGAAVPVPVDDQPTWSARQVPPVRESAVGQGR